MVLPKPPDVAGVDALGVKPMAVSCRMYQLSGQREPFRIPQESRLMQPAKTGRYVLPSPAGSPTQTQRLPYDPPRIEREQRLAEVTGNSKVTGNRG